MKYQQLSRSQRLDVAICVPSTGLGSFGFAPLDSFPVKGKEGVQMLHCRGGSLNPASAASVGGLPCSPPLYLFKFFFQLKALLRELSTLPKPFTSAFSRALE